MRLARLAALAIAGFFASGVPAGCSAGVVGGECRDGYDVCSGRCVDLRNDAEHCGSCSRICDEGVDCMAGLCGGTDASTGMGGGGGASGNDAGHESGGAAGVSTNGGAGGTDAGRDGGTHPPRDASTDGDAKTDASLDGGTGGTGAGGSSGADGTAGTGGTAGAGGTDGSAGTGGTDGSAGTGGAENDAAVCVPPYDTPAQCGACRTSCPPEAPLCSLGNDGYFCTPLCDPPLIPCGGQCVNLQSDENNCGQCARHCASGICQGGQCVGATAGHEVVLCMDYAAAASAGSGEEQLLENAIFIGPRATVRILGYTEDAATAEIATVRTTLDTAAKTRGRAYALTASASSLDVANLLNVRDFEVLLVYDQPSAPAGRLANAGASMADAIDGFVRAGGVVVVLAGPTGRGEMADFVTSAGLVATTGQTVVTTSQIFDRAPADAIGVNVVSPFRAPRETCTFTTAAPSDDTTVFVVTDSASSSGMLGAPVVVHRVIAP